MSEYLAQINELLDHIFAHGAVWVYLVIWLACFIENITPPFPGDSFIVAAGGLVAASRLETVTALLVVVTGGMTSVMIIYFLGRKFGREYFIRKNYKLFSASDVLAVEKRFERHGGLVLLVSRFVVGFRVALVLASGMGRYPAGKVMLYIGLSYVAFSGLLMYLGYKLVENYERIEYYFDTYHYIAWPLVGLVVVTYIVRRIQKNRQAKQK